MNHNNIIPDVLNSFKYDTKKRLLVISILTAFLIIDISFSNISDKINMASKWGVASFMSIATIFCISQYLILEFVKEKGHEIRSKSQHIAILDKIIRIVQFSLAAIILVIFVVLIASYYYEILLTIAMTISYGVAGVALMFLAQKFFVWYSINRNFTLLLFGVSTTTLVISAVVTLIFYDIILLGKQGLVYPYSSVTFTEYDQRSMLGMLNSVYTVFNVVSSILFWGSAALLFSYYSKILGKIRLWVIISIPLIYFLSEGEILGLFPTTSNNNPILMIIYSFPGLAFGILFGMAFLFIARKMQKNNPVRDYLHISAYGLILFFVAVIISKISWRDQVKLCIKIPRY